MNTEFRLARLPEELRALMVFDRKVFTKADRFPAEYWRSCEVYWLLMNKVRVGCCAFQPDVSLDRNGEAYHQVGSLYIASTAIAPKYQDRGLGMLMKAWQLTFAKHKGYQRVVTNTRQSNAAMIALNERFGFRRIRTVKNYYSEPIEPTEVLQLRVP